MCLLDLMLKGFRCGDVISKELLMCFWLHLLPIKKKDEASFWATQILSGKSPLEAFFGRTSKYHKLQVFGCKCFPCIRLYKSNKLVNKCFPCIFIGYPINQDDCLYLDLVDRQIYSSRYVTCFEGDFSLNSKIFHYLDLIVPLTCTSPLIIVH